MTKLLFTLVLLIPFGLFAQTTEPITQPVRPANFVESDLKIISENSPDNRRSYREFDTRYEGVQGSPWLWEHWQQGELYTTDGQHIAKGVKFMFNVALNELHIRSDKDTAVVKSLRNQDVVSAIVAFDDQNVVVRSVQLPDDKTPRFCLQRHIGDQYELLLYIKKYLEKADYGKPMGPDRRYDEWLIEKKYFLRKGSKVQRLKLSRASLQKALPKAKKELENAEYNDVTEAKVIALLKKLEGK
jgi:hypothetical protein